MYNPDHGFDMEEHAIKKRIDAWQKSQAYGEKIKESLEKNSEKFFADDKAYQKWSSNGVNKDTIRGVNRAREKMIAGLTQFMDGLGELKEISGSWIVDPDYLNLLFMTAFTKSTFYEKTIHWAKAEEEYQKSRATSLPGGYSGNGEETIVRELDTQWFSLQFLYRQLEFTRFVPNYDIVAGIWALENNLSGSCSKLLDTWFYVHSANIKDKTDPTDFTKGYFFRYNAHMTSEAQAQTLYILTNLFRYTMSKSIGTLEYPPWFCDSTITGKGDGNLPHSKNIIPHRINLKDIQRLKESPIISTDQSGMMSLPTDVENGEDKELSGKIVKGKGKTLEKVEDEIDEHEVSRKDKGYKNKWDGEHVLEFDEGKVWVVNGEVVKIKTEEGRVERLKLADGTKYKVGVFLEY